MSLFLLLAHLEDLDCLVRRARGKPLSVVVHLCIVHHVRVLAIKGRNSRGGLSSQQGIVVTTEAKRPLLSSNEEKEVEHNENKE